MDYRSKLIKKLCLLMVFSIRFIIFNFIRKMAEVSLLSPSHKFNRLSTHQKSQLTQSNKAIETRCDDGLGFISSQSFNHQMSATEKEIFSHAIIEDVVSKSKKKTVQHHVNQISADTKLFVLPTEQVKGQFEFDSIPPKNKQYISTASEKVKQIHKRLSRDKSLAERLTELADKNKQKLNGYPRRTRTAMSVDDNVSKRVSISGLVSYNFNSIKARRSLGSIPNETEESEMARKMQEANRKLTRSLDRQSKIVKRKPNIDNLKRQQLNKAAVCDFYTPTDKFLKIVKREAQREEKIYGEQMQKLTCMKEYMGKEKVDYQQAKFIIESIMNSQKKPAPQIKKPKPLHIDDDEQLHKRKKVLNKKKLMLRHLCFTDV